ncbi:hypothetical protein R1T16_02185 [Flavobacterium sp. DG1-102-2]|uniref:hypothetical protein n=1 Tax=Flavobacterium sp. DG1-102-2 TaxID=3081663 RepID=UPI0029490EE8|nr:hypothetical protein [Flavobacterium sp. DG1-102-2]MDV6167215.1 hypothetical protein [Flavobacterium sp. DG1-102-2]
MKKTYLLIVLGAFLVSCSSDDDSTNGNNNPDQSYFPSEQGKYWVYDVNSNVMNGRDSLFVTNDTLINSTTYKKLKTKEEFPFGFFSNSLRNNAIRQSDGKTYLSGAVGFNISEDLPLSLPINDFVIFDENATENQQLGSINGTLQQEVQGYNLGLTYTLSAKAKAPISSFTSGPQTYTNVKPVEITLNLGINVTTEIAGFPITFPLMSQQNVVVSTQYYAQGIGVVKTSTNLSYQLSEIPVVQLPIPTTGSEQQDEVLVKYSTE